MCFKVEACLKICKVIGRKRLQEKRRLKLISFFFKQVSIINAFLCNCCTFLHHYNSEVQYSFSWCFFLLSRKLLKHLELESLGRLYFDAHLVVCRPPIGFETRKIKFLKAREIK
jgi:hypothetical protein